MTVRDTEGRTIFLSRVAPSASSLRAAAVVPVLSRTTIALGAGLGAGSAGSEEKEKGSAAAPKSPESTIASCSPSPPPPGAGGGVETMDSHASEPASPDDHCHGHHDGDRGRVGGDDDGALASPIASPPPSPDAAIADATAAAASTTARSNGTHGRAHGRASDIFTDTMEIKTGEHGQSIKARAVTAVTVGSVVLSTSAGGCGGGSGVAMPSDDELTRALSGVALP